MSQVLRFVGNHLDKGYLAANILRAASVTYQSRNLKNFSTIKKIDWLFSTLDIATLIWGAKQLLDIAHKKFKLYDYCEPVVVIYGGGILVLAWIVSNIGIVFLINEVTKPKQVIEVPITKKLNIQVGWGESTYKKFLQFLSVSHLSIAIPLTFFSKRPLFYLGNVLSRLYSLVKTCAWRWIHFDCTFEVPLGPLEILYKGPKKFIFTYLGAFFPSKKEAECAICFEEKKTHFFCKDHSFCDTCLISSIYSKMEAAMNGAHYQRTEKTLKNRDGFQSKVISYTIRLKKEQLPSCPLCRKHPNYNEIEVNVQDRMEGRNLINASVSFDAP